MNELNTLTSAIIGAAITVHKEMGPGLLESVYQQCFEIELRSRGHQIQGQLPVLVMYRDVAIAGEAFRIDILVENEIVVELKSVEQLKPVHSKQLLTYLKLTGKQLGLLINFNEVLLKDGIVRMANNLDEGSPRPLCASAR